MHPKTYFNKARKLWKTQKREDKQGKIFQLFANKLYG